MHPLMRQKYGIVDNGMLNDPNFERTDNKTDLLVLIALENVDEPLLATNVRKHFECMTLS